MKVFYTARSNNVKTGDVPQQFIGGSRKESMDTCFGCKLLESKVCYAQFKSVGWAHSNVIKHAPHKDYTLETALLKRSPHAKYFRFGTIGDPSGIDDNLLVKAESAVRRAGLRVLNYTHFWATRGKHLVGRAMASCDSMAEAVKAVKAGWRATVVVPQNFVDKWGTKGVYKGLRWAVCPYQTHGTQCNDCGLCDGARKDLLPIIVFKQH